MIMVWNNFDFNLNFSPIERSLVKPMIGNTDKIISKTIDESGKLFLKLVKFYAPRDKGDYARSWKIVEKTKTSVTIASNQDILFIALEFGVDHEVRIDAKNAKYLHWKDASGADHFAKFVIIPPRKAQPHVRRAIKDMRKIWKDIALAQMGELIPAFKVSTRNNRQKVEQLESKLNKPN